MTSTDRSAATLEERKNTSAPAKTAQRTEDAASDVRFCSHLRTLLTQIGKLGDFAIQSGKDSINSSITTIGTTAIEFQEKQKKSLDIMLSVFKASYPHWESIRVRDEKFFIEKSDTIFPNTFIDSKKIVVLWIGKKSDGTPLVSDTNKTMVWNSIHNMIKCILKHAVKAGKLTKADGSELKVADIVALCKTWGVAT